MSTTSDHFDVPQHLLLSGVSWEYYEHTLEQIGDRPLRVSFLDGEIEIISPLPGHETLKKAIARLIETLTLELGIAHKSFGSTTFRAEEKSAGTEPDECYYFHDIECVKGMRRFDALIYPAPNLVVEMDILSPSVPREPICARLGVGEIWRYNGRRLEVRRLGDDKIYSAAVSSQVFPFLPMARFAEFIAPMVERDETAVLREFRDWVRLLPQVKP